MELLTALAADVDPARLDAADPLAAFRDRFAVPDPELLYLDGNSLGRPPRATLERLTRVAEAEWAGELIGAGITGWASRGGSAIGSGRNPRRTPGRDDHLRLDDGRLLPAGERRLDARPGRGSS
jgi:kynureninase